jgi:hypothetical protein
MCPNPQNEGQFGDVQSYRFLYDLDSREKLKVQTHIRPFCLLLSCFAKFVPWTNAGRYMLLSNIYDPYDRWKQRKLCNI